MMNQNRTVNMINRLASDHHIDLLISDTNDDQLVSEIMPEVNTCFYFKSHKNFSLVRKFFFYIKTCILTCILIFPEHYHTISNLSLKRKLKSTLINNKYEIVLLHYWWLQKMLPKKWEKPVVIIDTHGLLFEKVILEGKLKTGFLSRKLEAIYSRNYQKQELSSLNSADLLIFNSEKDKTRFDKENKSKVESLTIANGQNLSYFNPELFPKSSNTILFYGSLGGLQNQLAFERFWKNIFPVVLHENKKVRLIILGNEPPAWIQKLQSDMITVTGFVHDVRPYIAKSNVCILPLTIGSGFRGRAVEVMSMGLPIVGTHNALDNLNITNGVHGFITDDDVEMANYALELLKNDELKQKMASKCIKFVEDNFSIEATYGKLSSVLKRLN